MTTRRSILVGGGAAATLAATTGFANRALAASGDFPFALTDAEWRARLTPAQYAVLREEATERRWSSPLNEEKRAGIYHCAGCGQALFTSETKYESHSGWPSFWDYIPGALGFKEDRSFFMVRTEEHCSNCGGHQGHVFNDGPQPTGLRHCINGLALEFRPA